MKTKFSVLSGSFKESIDREYLSIGAGRLKTAGLELEDDTVKVPAGAKVKRLSSSKSTTPYVDAYEIVLPGNAGPVKFEYPKSRRLRFRRKR